eukprot:63800_1
MSFLAGLDLYTALSALALCILHVSPISSQTSITRCDASFTQLDLIIILDSSGSVLNRNQGEDPMRHWYTEINFAKAIVNKSLPTDSRVGAINFSGCESMYNNITCRYDEGQLVRLWGLLDHGTPNDLQAVLNRTEQIDEDDFLGGKTWTNEALGIALEEFKANSTEGRQRMILMLTDGHDIDPRAEHDHDPCYREWNGVIHTSATLLALRELNVTIITIAIGLSQNFIETFFERWSRILRTISFK